MRYIILRNQWIFYLTLFPITWMLFCANECQSSSWFNFCCLKHARSGSDFSYKGGHRFEHCQRAHSFLSLLNVQASRYNSHGFKKKKEKQGIYWNLGIDRIMFRVVEKYIYFTKYIISLNIPLLVISETNFTKFFIIIWLLL